MNLPMREKYVDEAAGFWFVFGEYPDGCVDINNGQQDVLCHIPRDVADKAIAAQAAFREALYALLCRGAP